MYLKKIRRFFAKNYWDINWLRRTPSVWHPPYYINVELTNICNLKCKYCSMDNSRPRGMMDINLFEKIIREAEDMGIPLVHPFIAGEPLIYNKFEEALKILDTVSLDVEIHTNANLLTGDISEKILLSKVNRISFSLDEDNESDYNKVRINGNWKKVNSNIFRFLEMRKKSNSKIQVAVQFIRERNRAEVSKEYLAKFKKFNVDEFKIINPHTWGGEIKDKEIGFRERGGIYFPCYLPWYVISITYDGKILTCCADLNGKQVIGDFSKTGLKDFWNSEKMIEFRLAHINKKFKDYPLCANCEFTYHKVHPVKKRIRELTLL